MPLFKQTAEAPTQPKAPAHVHHHTPSQAAPIIAKAAVHFITGAVLWGVGLYFLSTLGVREPSRTLVQIVVWGGIGAIAIIVLERWISTFLDKWSETRIEIERERTAQLRIRQHTAQSASVDTRAKDEEQTLFYNLVIGVLLQAYDDYSQQGYYQGSARPWSRRAAAQYVPIGTGVAVGEGLGGKVKPFLEQYEIIRDNQLNIARFPDVASVQRLLFEPIAISRVGGASANNPPPLPETTGTTRAPLSMDY